jgi:hypothetical protein
VLFFSPDKAGFDLPKFPHIMQELSVIIEDDILSCYLDPINNGRSSRLNPVFP